MPNRIPRIIACSLFLYRWLLALAPDEFFDGYAEPALQVFRQCCWDSYHQQGTRGVLRLWLPTLADALHSILAEQGTTLKQVLCPRLVWPVALALSCMLFPFSWLSNAWAPFGSLFHLLFATPQIYIAGHVALFSTVGLILLLCMPGLRKHAQLYILCLTLGAFTEESIQILVNAHPGLHKGAHNFPLDLCGILLGYLLFCFWRGRRFLRKSRSDAPL